MKKVFISGVAGFIGSHLAEKLLENNCIVTGLDNFSTGLRKNLEHIVAHPNFELVEGDIKNCKLVAELLEGCESVFHLSDNSDIQFSATHPKDYFEQNIIGLYNILAGMKEHNISKIIFPSSTTVFGPDCIIPTPENYGPLRPANLYGASKAAAEAFLCGWVSTYNICAINFRFTSVIGARQDHGVVHDFVKKLLKDNSKLEVLGNGKQERSYILIDDCVDVLTWSVNQFKEGFNVIHLGNKDVVKISKVAEIVCEEMNIGRNVISYLGDGLGWKGDSKSNELDVKTLNNFGWIPKYNSQAAVREAARRLFNQFS